MEGRYQWLTLVHPLWYSRKQMDALAEMLNEFFGNELPSNNAYEDWDLTGQWEEVFSAN